MFFSNAANPRLTLLNSEQSVTMASRHDIIIWNPPRGLLDLSSEGFGFDNPLVVHKRVGTLGQGNNCPNSRRNSIGQRRDSGEQSNKTPRQTHFDRVENPMICAGTTQVGLADCSNSSTSPPFICRKEPLLMQTKWIIMERSARISRSSMVKSKKEGNGRTVMGTQLAADSLAVR